MSITTEIFVENLKCGGCENTIQKAIAKFPEVLSSEASAAEGKILIRHNPELPMEKLKNKLAQLGYPEVGQLEGLAKTTAFAKSYVSCAIGKFTSSEKTETDGVV
jgi:copper chaperone